MQFEEVERRSWNNCITHFSPAWCLKVRDFPRNLHVFNDHCSETFSYFYSILQLKTMKPRTLIFPDTFPITPGLYGEHYSIMPCWDIYVKHRMIISELPNFHQWNVDFLRRSLNIFSEIFRYFGSLIADETLWKLEGIIFPDLPEKLQIIRKNLTPSEGSYGVPSQHMSKTIISTPFLYLTQTPQESRTNPQS